MGMTNAEAESFKSICRSIVDGMGKVSRSLKSRIERLEAENKELRQLWADNEKWGIETKIRVDRLYQAARFLNSDECPCEHKTRKRASS